MMWEKPQLLLGQVMHRRYAPKAHAFTYPVFTCLLPMHQLEHIRSPIFSLNRFNLLSWHARDHGARDGTDPRIWVRRLLATNGLTTADGDIWLQTFPRMLGFVFNPVSFWYCHDREGKLRAVVAEVSNTFGEQHNYLVAHADQRPIGSGDVIRCNKVFHVSPFFPVNGHYLFRFALREGSVRVRIDYADSTGNRFLATVSGAPRAWSSRALLHAFLAYPLMTLAVVVRIHWQAAVLYFRRDAHFYRKPQPPHLQTTR